MAQQDPTVQAILAEQQQALDGIDKQFHQTTFMERMNTLFTGLKADKGSREYKLALVEAQRLMAPALAITLPCLLMGSIAIFASNDSKTRVEWEAEIIEIKETEKLEKIEKEPPPPMDFEMPDVNINVDWDTPPPPDFVPMDTITAQPADFDAVLKVKSPVTMPKIYAGERTGSKGMLLAKYGKGTNTGAGEEAVLRVLRWLKKNQNDDGSWPNTKPAMTGLALLCFLSRGVVPGDPSPEGEEFGETVQKAIQYLLNTYQGNRWAGSDGHEYSFPIAVYALCEAYGMTQIPNIKPVAESALKRLINGQHPTGGWDYNMAQNDRDDTSWMGWAAQALKAAKMARMFSSDPEWSDKLDKACKLSNNGFLKNGANGGGFGYTGPGRGGLTGVGTLCMQFHGMGNHKQVKDSLVLMDAWKAGWFATEAELNAAGMRGIGGCTQYYYYYAAQAKFHDGGARWEDWNKIMNPAYVKAQKVLEKNYPDHKGQLQDIGWWENVDNHTDDGSRAKPVMDTCLAALQLMIPYRYLPTATQAAVKIDDDIMSAIATEKGDVAVDIGNL